MFLDHNFFFYFPHLLDKHIIASSDAKFSVTRTITAATCKILSTTHAILALTWFCHLSMYLWSLGSKWFLDHLEQTIINYSFRWPTKLFGLFYPYSRNKFTLNCCFFTMLQFESTINLIYKVLLYPRDICLYFRSVLYQVVPI